MRNKKNFGRLQSALKEHGTKPLDELAKRLNTSEYKTKQLMLQYLILELESLPPEVSIDKYKYLFKIFKYFENVDNEQERKMIVQHLNRASIICNREDRNFNKKNKASSEEYNIYKKFLDIINVLLINLEYRMTVTKEVATDNKISYELLKYLIFDVRNYNYLFELFKMFPSNLIIKNDNGVYLIEELIARYIELVRNNKANCDIIYFEKVIKLFLTDEKFCIEEETEEKLIRLLEATLNKIDNGNQLPKDKDKSSFFINEAISDIRKKELSESSIKAINFKYDVCPGFNWRVINDSKQRMTVCNSEQILDCRDKYTVTVDNPNTWVYDDACSLEKLANGNYLLGIYVADATNAVPRNSLVDIEAKKRAESVYCPGSVITMFPIELTNNLSLKQGIDRNAIGFFFELDAEANPIDFTIRKCLINVKCNYSYDKVNSLLTDSRNIEEIKYLKNLFYISSKFHENSDARMQYRTLKKIKKAVKNDVISTNPTNDIASTMIADFMVQTNAFVANYFHKHPEIPFIYRINLSSYGKDVVGKIKEIGQSSISFQDMLDYINYICPPSTYSVVNLGHNGLALPAYCHVTNPLRNYSSLEIERIIVDHIINDGHDINLDNSRLYLEKLCAYMNERISMNNDYIHEAQEYYKKYPSIDKK